MIELIRGDKDIIECSATQDISNWKLRVEIYDNSGNKIKKANSLIKYGSDEQIKIDENNKKLFSVFIDIGDTDNIGSNAFFDLELESPDCSILLSMQDRIKITNP